MGNLIDGFQDSSDKFFIPVSFETRKNLFPVDFVFTINTEKFSVINAVGEFACRHQHFARHAANPGAGGSERAMLYKEQAVGFPSDPAVGSKTGGANADDQIVNFSHDKDSG